MEPFQDKQWWDRTIERPVGRGDQTGIKWDLAPMYLLPTLHANVCFIWCYYSSSVFINNQQCGTQKIMLVSLVITMSTKAAIVSRVFTGQGKLENVGEFVLSGKCQGKILFLKSQGKWSLVMQTADNCDFLHLQILISRQICSFHWMSWTCFGFRGLCPYNLLTRASGHLHIALLIPFHYLIPFMTFVQ